MGERSTHGVTLPSRDLRLQGSSPTSCSSYTDWVVLLRSAWCFWGKHRNSLCIWKGMVDVPGGTWGRTEIMLSFCRATHTHTHTPAAEPLGWFAAAAEKALLWGTRRWVPYAQKLISPLFKKGPAISKAASVSILFHSSINIGQPHFANMALPTASVVHVTVGAVIQHLDESFRTVFASPAANSHLGFARGAKNILQLSHQETVGLGWNQNQLPKTIVFILIRAKNWALRKASQWTTTTLLGSIQDGPRALHLSNEWTKWHNNFANSWVLLNFHKDRTGRSDFTCECLDIHENFRWNNIQQEFRHKANGFF